MRQVIGVIVTAIALAACGEDPSLRVNVDHERPMLITRLVVSVYESPSITCEQIEYADLDEVQLAALLVAEQTITGDTVTGSLDGMSRTDPKLIVARGYAQTGELLEGGCAAHGLVVENDSVRVTTHLIATVSAQPADDAPYRLGVLVTDRDGVALEDRPISYRMYGPVGSVPTQATGLVETDDGNWQPLAPACSNQNGTSMIYPVTPNVVGGFAVSVRVAWANQIATLFSGVTNTDFALTTLTIPDETKHPCAVSVKIVGGVATKRLVCVDRMVAMTFAREFPVTVSNGVATLGSPTSAVLGRPPVGLFALPGIANPAEREVYAVDKDGQLTPLFGAGPAQPVTCSGCADHIVDAMIAPACGARDPARLLLVNRNVGVADRLNVAPARGGATTEISIPESVAPDLTINLNNAGCVTANGPDGYEPRQLMVLDLVTPVLSITRGFYDCSAQCKRVALPVAETAVAFTKTSPPYVIGTASDATGVVLATWGLIPDPLAPTTDRLVERAARVPSAGAPNKLAVGTFDEDEGSDLIWDVSLRGRNGATLEVAYSKPVQGGQLQALSVTLKLTVLDLFATDVSNDDHDDIILVARTPVANEAGVIVVPTHAIAPAKTLPISTCGP